MKWPSTRIEATVNKLNLGPLRPKRTYSMVQIHNIFVEGD